MRWKYDGRSLVVESPAKLNLFLEILGKRSDGYHELESLMVTVDWYDTLRFTVPGHDEIDRSKHDEPRLDHAEPVESLTSAAVLASSHEATARSDIRLRCFTSTQPGQSSTSGSLPAGSDNLIVRAAELLRSHAGIRRSVTIDLHKRIPMAAGLAGGSGNAAATLWALNRLWGLDLAGGELQALASQLGSDIAFFLGGATAAVCRGRGEIVEPATVPAGLCFVIARPASGLSTAEVYRHCRPSASPQRVEPLVESLQRGRLDVAGKLLHNALQAPAEVLNEEVRRLKQQYSQEPVLGHRMSGSGTAWFALCAHRGQARRVAARLAAQGVPYTAVVQTRP